MPGPDHPPVFNTLDTLPVLADGDLLVAGGSFAGIAAALRAAQSGMRVVLVEPRTYLGREVTAVLRPWFRLAGQPGEAQPDVIQTCITAAGTPEQSGGPVLLRIGALKIHLEDRLLQGGVRLLYASQPVELLQTGGRVSGLVIGNKSGRQIITAPYILDASETALVARLAGLALPYHAGPARYARTMEFDRVGEIEYGPLPVPDNLGLAGDAVNLIPGARGEGHLFVEFPLELDSTDGALAWTEREIAAREITMAAAGYLIRNVSAFRKAIPAAGAQLLHGPLVSGSQLDEGQPPVSLLPGLYLLSPAASPGPTLLDPVSAAGLGEALGRQIGEAFAVQGSLPAVPGLTSPASARIEPTGLQVHEPYQPQRGRDNPRLPVPLSSLPVLGQADVLVAGGGTSGATAATVAARTGARVLLAELNTSLGGTGTLGGVHSYWFGRRTGYAREVIEEVAAVHAELGIAPPEGSLLKWNIEAKMLALLRRARRAGAAVLFGATITGAVREGRHVRGVAVATPYGPAALLGETVIDATGDGDVAAFAGAEFIYGAARDHITMWYALAQFYRPGVTQNNFTSMVDVSNVEDYTRAILAGRRRFEGHDQGTYVAPRESRHILGEVVLTLNDQLRKRTWPDTVSIAFSNHDVKGHTSSDWLRAGLIPPNLEVEIPYRALLPRGLTGLLVVGKAISATHDAQPAVRMQPDLENLGGAAGLAAALAVQSGYLPHEVDLPALQRALVQAGVLPEAVLDRTAAPDIDQPHDLQALLDEIDPARPLYAYQDMELDVVFEGRIPLVDLCCAGPRVVPFLEAALASASGPRRLLAARALALVGSPAGVPDLVAAIQAETADEGLQKRSGHIRHANLPPDQAAMPDVVYLLYTLGMARDERALPVWEHFAGLAAEASPNDLRDRFLGLFYYVDAVCYGAERLGSPRAIPALRRLHASSLFLERVNRTGFEPDFFLERQAYLELVIARALARCGDKAGFETLVNYLDDTRALLAEHAHSELKAISGADFGKDSAAWRAWIADWQPVPNPVSEPNEPVQAWND